MDTNRSLGMTLMRVADDLITKHGAEAVSRVLGLVEILSGKRKALPDDPRQRANSVRNRFPVWLPDLPSEPWLARERFPWVDDLEGASRGIRRELDQLLTGHPRRIVPYKYAGSSAPQLASWNAFYFYRNGQRVDENCALCPNTAAELDAIPLNWEAFFSILEPDARIPPHTDIMNFQIVCHLGLDIPEDSGIRVGGETRRWEEGRCLFMDTSFVHEAWNHSSRRRIVLILDTFHPALTGVEVEALQYLKSVLPFTDRG
jgi:aspartate beta-hydroxylase